MKLTRIASSFAALSLSIPSLSAAVFLDFNSAASFDHNFYRAGGTGDAYWDTNRIIKGDDLNGAVSYIYNSSATGGSGGTGGTAGGETKDTFENFRIQADYRINSLGSSATSLGYYVKTNDALNSGYVVVFRLADGGASGNIDMRVFGPNTTMSATGTLLSASQTIAATSTISTSTYYTIRLDVLDVEGAVKFIGSVWTTSGTQIGNTVEYTHSGGTAITGAGQVGLRIGTGVGSSNRAAIDNFRIDPIPEPSTIALLAPLAGLALRRRR
jgi:hypothetical protein